MPRCSVVIVTYNSADSITACLEALAGQDCEMVVVDNASQDDTVSRVADFSGRHAVELVRISRNVGFAAGVHHGVRATTGDILLILNPDAVAEPAAVSALVDCMARTGAAAAGGALLQPDGAPARGFSFRRLPTLGSLLSEVLLWNQVWPANPINRRYRCLDADYSQVQEVEQPAGACLAVRREAWDKIGGMDKQFTPVWFEDVDFCKRLRDAGGKIIYCPAARFHHVGAHSVGKLDFQQRQLYWYANMLRYARKHLPPWSVFLLRGAIVKGMLLRWLAVSVGKRPQNVSRGEAGAAYKRVISMAIASGFAWTATPQRSSRPGT